MIGRTISHYRILDKLGEGGMGVVYRADDTRLERTVALKFLAPHALDRDARQRFLHEAKAAARLDHSNICGVYEIGEADGQMFMAMPFVDGVAVSERLAHRPLPLREVIDIAVQAGQGLQAAHAKGIVHRDVKSANLMLTREGRVLVMDFGLAYLAEHTRLTATETFLGTPTCRPSSCSAKPSINERTSGRSAS